MRKKLQFPLLIVATAATAVALAVIALFVPTTLALSLVGMAAFMVAVGAVVLARQL